MSVRGSSPFISTLITRRISKHGVCAGPKTRASGIVTRVLHYNIGQLPEWSKGVLCKRIVSQVRTILLSGLCLGGGSEKSCTDLVFSRGAMAARLVLDREIVVRPHVAKLAYLERNFELLTVLVAGKGRHVICKDISLF